MYIYIYIYNPRVSLKFIAPMCMVCSKTSDGGVCRTCSVNLYRLCSETSDGVLRGTCFVNQYGMSMSS